MTALPDVCGFETGLGHNELTITHETDHENRNTQSGHDAEQRQASDGSERSSATRQESDMSHTPWATIPATSSPVPRRKRYKMAPLVAASPT